MIASVCGPILSADSFFFSPKFPNFFQFPKCHRIFISDTSTIELKHNYFSKSRYTRFSTRYANTWEAIFTDFRCYGNPGPYGPRSLPTPLSPNALAICCQTCCIVSSFYHVRETVTRATMHDNWTLGRSRTALHCIEMYSKTKKMDTYRPDNSSICMSMYFQLFLHHTSHSLSLYIWKSISCNIGT